jgi:cobalamin biosynthesis protein CbiG
MTRLWLGIGCQQGASGESIESAILQTLALQDLNIADVVGVASIDLKAQEPGILAVCAKYHWQLQTYSAAELDNVQIQQPSGTVFQLVGTNSVAEAAAMLAGGQELLVRKQVYSIGGKFITVAIVLNKPTKPVKPIIPRVPQ